jgi:hypothetical protein
MKTDLIVQHMWSMKTFLYLFASYILLQNDNKLIMLWSWALHIISLLLFCFLIICGISGSSLHSVPDVIDRVVFVYGSPFPHMCFWSFIWSNALQFRYILCNKKLKIYWLAQMCFKNMTWIQSKVIKNWDPHISATEPHSNQRSLKKILCGVHNGQSGTGKFSPVVGNMALSCQWSLYQCLISYIILIHITTICT